VGRTGTRLDGWGAPAEGGGTVSPWQLIEHVSDRDLEFLWPRHADHFRRDPRLLVVALDAPDLFARLAGDREALVKVSPFVLFSVMLRQAIRDLRQARFTVERAGLRQKVAVFDAAQVHTFLQKNPDIVDYLSQVLASFTHVYSGSTWQRTKRGWRRQRFSELDLRSMEALEAEASEEDRFYLDRRMGEVALFLLGVFPDAVLRPRLRGMGAAELEVVGALRYGRAATHPLAARTGTAGLLSTVSEGFRWARKALNYMTDRYLYPFRAEWFPAT